MREEEEELIGNYITGEMVDSQLKSGSVLGCLREEEQASEERHRVIIWTRNKRALPNHKERCTTGVGGTETERGTGRRVGGGENVDQFLREIAVLIAALTLRILEGGFVS
jgi:hypothetical protein